jgi:hypothetical protein
VAFQTIDYIDVIQKNKVDVLRGDILVPFERYIDSLFQKTPVISAKNKPFSQEMNLKILIFIQSLKF